MLPRKSALLSTCSAFAFTIFLPATITLVPTQALAACTTTGSATVCTSAAPAVWTATVGTGRTNNNRTVEVQSGAQINTINANAISIGDGGTITVRNGGSVTNSSTPSGSGLFGTGPNTIEFGSNGQLIVEQGGQVIANGTNTRAEAVNVHGFGNTIINRGLIQGQSSAAIWFEDQVTGAKNTVDNYGTIQKLGGGSVIGTNGGAGINFINRTGGQVVGDLSFAGGNDTLTFEPDSVVTGNINGGGGINDLILQGILGSSDTLAGALRNFTTLTKNGDGLWTVSGSLSGFTTVTVNDGTLALTGDNVNYTGTVIVRPDGVLEARAQSLPVKTIAVNNVNNVQNDGLVRFTQPDNGTYTGQIVGSGAVEKTGAGVLTLAPATTAGNTYSGGTTINEGTVAVSADNAFGNANGGLNFNGGALRFDTSFDLANSRAIVLNAGGGTFDTNGNTTNIAQAISGSGALTKAGAGVLNLEGANAYGGATTVTGGALYVNGDQTAATGATSVNSGAKIGGVGTIGGNVAIQDGGTLAPGRAGDAPGALTINGDLALSGGSSLEYSFGQANVVGGPLNDLTTVQGDLTLDGTINVVATPGGSFDPGVYRVISYNGNLTDNGLEIGTIPASGYYVQTAVANQVNLVNTSGLNLTYWDVWPAANGAIGNGAVNGGTGTWQSSGSGGANINWTEPTGTINAPYQDDAFAIFMATAGTVTVDNSVGDVRASGMQFASNGYVVTGDAITLVGSPSSIIRVGDGTAASAGYIATINSVLTGNTQLTKTDLGTLVVGGTNTYTGGTAINGGVLQVANNANLGDAAGSISFDGGTLRTTADFTIDRATALQTGGGTIDTIGATTLEFDGVVSGDGGLTKIGSGTLVLNGTNTYAGGSAINGGTVQIASDASLGAASGPLSIDAGTLHSTSNISMNRTTTIGAGNATIQTDAGTTLTQQGNIAGAGAITKTGDGALVLTGAGTYTGGTTIASGLLQLGDGGTSGSIVGDVTNNGTLAFNRTGTLVFDGVISGAGDVRHIGTGVTVLNKQSAYTGATSVEAGTLAAGGTNYFSSNSNFTVAQTGTLALNDFNQSLKSLSNSGIVDLGPNAGTTLTVTGNYTGNDGTVLIGTVLGNDSSVTDRLVVNGDANGTGLLAVKNMAGSGAQTSEGIKIVDINGASNATFTLLGDYQFQGAPAVVGGAYAYQLYKNGKANPNDGDWYLRSTIKDPTDGGGTNGGGDDGEEIPLYQPGVPSYEAYPQLLLGLNSLPTLQQRVGNRYWSNAGNVMLAEGADPIGSPYAPAAEAGNLIEGNGVWGRIEGAHTNADPRFSTSETDYSFNTLKLQAGLDGVLAETENGKLIGGITVHYAHGKAKTSSLYGDGEISTDGYGFGGTLTWYGDNGFYLDGQAQVTWYDSDLMSDLANMGLTDSNNGFGYTFSAESGKRIVIDQSWSLTPQAQLTYSSIDFDSFNDAFDSRISLDRGRSLQGRIGLSLEQQNSWYNANGLIDRTYLYGIANVYYEFLDGTKVDVSGTSFASKNERLWGGIGLGGSYNWNSDKYSIYGEGSVNTSLKNFGDSYSYKGTLGFRVRF
ncbi:outer membrane autotransporter barrel domain protein [Ochrobactrum quorumnocens]|uniref:Outer membrane autotransporter barrel domain protein n=1 Tax=Ochrobactrum quorumnocens TaxID=271865 RepID=A0A248UAF7_9HYPH|nr:autotransporter outer membrane beta-barrel domain-containing protein [[Ochrobactrum] quorumnocens]ASV83763.1 outer membrane autotransporter barrel domain protein [[Ochrobactrum] quorumnocens]